MWTAELERRVVRHTKECRIEEDRVCKSQYLSVNSHIWRQTRRVHTESTSLTTYTLHTHSKTIEWKLCIVCCEWGRELEMRLSLRQRRCHVQFIRSQYRCCHHNNGVSPYFSEAAIAQETIHRNETSGVDWLNDQSEWCQSNNWRNAKVKESIFVSKFHFYLQNANRKTEHTVR